MAKILASRDPETATELGVMQTLDAKIEQGQVVSLSNPRVGSRVQDALPANDGGDIARNQRSRDAEEA